MVWDLAFSALRGYGRAYLLGLEILESFSTLRVYGVVQLSVLRLRLNLHAS